jgi:hypothetical protein
MKESQLRDLNRKLQDVARAHFSFSQAAALMAHVNEHLSALAYAEETAIRNIETGESDERARRRTA